MKKINIHWMDACGYAAMELFLVEKPPVATVEKPVSNTANGRIRVPYTADFEKARARYVRVHFDVQVNTFLDEIEVYGGALTDDARPLSPTAPVEEELYFDDGADIGVRDIMCFHNGYYPQDETLVNNTKDVFRSYIGYVDSTGKYVDTMFDAIMFLTLQGLCPSGGKLTKDGGPTLLSDWEYLLDNTFGEGINLDALNEATACPIRTKRPFTSPCPIRRSAIWFSATGTATA